MLEHRLDGFWILDRHGSDRFLGLELAFAILAFVHFCSATTVGSATGSPSAACRAATVAPAVSTPAATRIVEDAMALNG